jgi:hypothetical protein
VTCFDVFEFQRAATDLLGAEVVVFSGHRFAPVSTDLRPDRQG